MPKPYKKLSGNYEQMMHAFDVPFPEAYCEPSSKDAYVTQLEIDRYRGRYVSLDLAISHKMIRQQVYDPQTYEQTQTFSQGDFYAGIAKIFFTTESVLLSRAQMGRRIKDLGFSYIDQDGQIRGLSIFKIPSKEDPPTPSQYAIAISSNIHQSPNNRNLSLLCEETLLDEAGYDNSRHQIAEELLNTDDDTALTSLKDLINSEKHYQFIRDLLENGTISDQKFQRLKALVDATVNSHDVILQQLPQLLQTARELDQNLAATIEQNADTTLEFFQPKSYERLLADVTNRAIAAVPKNIERTRSCQILQLEFLIKMRRNQTNDIQNTKDVMKNGLSQAKLAELWTTFSQTIEADPMPFDRRSFDRRCQRIYRQQYYDKCLEGVNGLENAIIDTANPQIKQEGLARLENLRGLKLTDLSEDKRTFTLEFIEALTKFMKTPSKETYRALKPFYKGHETILSALKPAIKVEMKQQEYRDALSALRTAMSQNRQSIKLNEIARRHVRQHHNDVMQDKSPADQKTILAFTTTFAALVKTPTEEAAQALARAYPEFGISEDVLKEAILADKQQRIYEEQLKNLKDLLKTSAQLYVNAEVMQQIEALDRVPFESRPLKNQKAIIRFVATLSAFTEEPTQATYQRLMKQYQRLGLGLDILDQHKLLQNAALNPYNIILEQEISKIPYFFDLQGQVIYTGHDKEAQPITISRGLRREGLPPLFDQRILPALKKRVSDANSMQIRDLFLNIPDKAQIIPMQQELYLYFDRLSQRYKVVLDDADFDEHDRIAVLTTTMQKLQRQINTAYAEVLHEACLESSSSENLRDDVNIRHLNDALNKHRDRLLAEGQNILIKQINRQRAREKPATTEEEQQQRRRQSTHSVFHIDTTMQLGTWITSGHPEPLITHRRIKTLQVDETQEILAEIKRLRILTPSLWMTSGKTAATFQYQYPLIMKKLNDIYAIEYSVTHYAFVAPNDASGQVKQMLLAAHNNNRDLNKPVCHVQAMDISGRRRALGYHWLDFFGTGNEATLMTEMALCSQMPAETPLDLNSYQRFLQPAQSWGSSFYRFFIKSKIFAHTAEGREMKSQIQTKKNAWQAQDNLDDCDTQARTTQALQKLMAFDLHYGHDFAVLVQALSLATNPQAIINTHEQDPNLSQALGYANYFDMANLPPNIQASLNALAQARDKPTATASATALKLALQEHYIQHRYAAAAIPSIMQQSDGMIEQGIEDHDDLQSQLAAAPPPADAMRKLGKHRRSAPISSSHAAFQPENHHDHPVYNSREVDPRINSDSDDDEAEHQRSAPSIQPGRNGNDSD
ncbi:MAG: hypothetical protein NXI01_06995 [Gammaproteobacteria bacterium]|nr:hypothetical protein [Gammaproteobacteria bacterium]